MRRIESRIDTGSSQFATNISANVELAATLRERQQFVIDGGRGRARSIERHLARNKVMVRDRIDMVIDDGSPFLELSMLAAWGLHDDEVPGAGIVTGIGSMPCYSSLYCSINIGVITAFRQNAFQQRSSVGQRSFAKSFIF